MKGINKVKLKYIILTSIIIFLDQASKYFINNNFDSFENKDFYLFSIYLIKNNGAAFNLFSTNRIFLSFISVFSSIIIIYILYFKNNINNIEKYSLSFILGGSIGNGIDRVINGFVIDFIELNYVNFPVFNIADISINIGFLILLYVLIKKKN